MVARLHPEVEVLCEMIAQHKKSFEDVASATGIKPERFRRIIVVARNRNPSDSQSAQILAHINCK